MTLPDNGNSAEPTFSGRGRFCRRRNITAALLLALTATLSPIVAPPDVCIDLSLELNGHKICVMSGGRSYRVVRKIETVLIQTPEGVSLTNIENRRGPEKRQR